MSGWNKRTPIISDLNSSGADRSHHDKLPARNQIFTATPVAEVSVRRPDIGFAGLEGAPTGRKVNPT